ncbi:phage holin family protein [Boudabousia marimammalium]|uniref:Phage holin family protein n=1 Tax=Boudabousia marimammalium TaxID=156892 RepID=A0A1Q5PSY7_9ACTO|nr:phage holin family protein [Boudabousia marimammalium]OKL50629.1 hypothetical protein BM477_01365 [Boudabousia marimammalium]
MGFVISTIGGAVGLWVSAWLIPGIDVTQGTSTLSTVMIFLLLGAIFTLLNKLVRPVIKLVSLPLYLLTLGLFSLVVNAMIIGLTGWVTSHLEWGMTVSGFWPAVGAGLITAIISSLVITVLRTFDPKN